MSGHGVEKAGSSKGRVIVTLPPIGKEAVADIHLEQLGRSADMPHEYRAIRDLHHGLSPVGRPAVYFSFFIGL
jgi:hypothetical protein